MNYSFLIDQVEDFVRSKNRGKDPGELPFHNLKHTEQVVANASKIAGHYKLADQDFFVVIVAAWLLDRGYYSDDTPGNGEKGAQEASPFLPGLGVDPQIMTQISNCIRATRIPQTPENLLEEIVCDADLYYLGTDHFPESNKLLRKEAEQELGRKIDKNEWRLKTIAFLASHRYHTDFCRGLLESRKQENLDKLKSKILQEGYALPKAVQDVKPFVPEVENAEHREAPENKKQKNDRPDKGIETMFRISSGNHQRLSDMADNKANIMITTNSIILSVLISVLLRKLEDNAHLIVPTLMLLTVCVTTMVFAILATRPSVPQGRFTRAEVDEKRVNLLFFGNFYLMNYDDYALGMQAMMNDREFLYGSLTRDVYAQGVVLGKKYRLLRTGYNVFMFGIVASVIAFVVSSIFLGS